jgi:hypothetical protein
VTQLEPGELEQRKLILDLYKEIAVNERHFNEIEAKYRFLASAWALAMLGGLGFLATIKDGHFLSLSKEAIAAGIGFLGAIGISVVWNLDVRVYHQLLDAQFVEGLELERQHSWLPRGRLKMFSNYVGGIGNHESVRILPHIRMFYCATILVSLAIGVGFGVSSIPQIRGLPPDWVLPVTVASVCIGTVVATAWVIGIYRLSTSIPVQDWVNKRLAETEGLSPHALAKRY